MSGAARAALLACHPFDERCDYGTGPCRNHGGVVPGLASDARPRLPEPYARTVAAPFRLPDHEVIKDSGGYAFLCPAWGMWWRYSNKKSAEFFLSAHLAYPVDPCLGGPVTPEQEDALMEAEKRDV